MACEFIPVLEDFKCNLNLFRGYPLYYFMWFQIGVLALQADSIIEL